MRRSTGVIIFVTAVVLLLVTYYQFPSFESLIREYADFLTFLGILLAAFSIWYFSIEKKEISRKEIEEKVEKTLLPISGLCLGRDTELSNLEKDLTHKNVLLIKGIPGIGKTTVGLKFRDILEEKGYHTLWYQCDSESYEGFLLYLSDYLKNRGSLTFESLREQGIPPQERLKTAVQELCSYPTILFLDNFQVVNDSDFRMFKDHLKDSTLVVLSRTQPAFLLESYESLPSLDRDSSLDLLRTLEVKESPEMLERIYEKTQGHPWSLVQFADIARVLPVKELLDELPDFGKGLENYMNEECWRYLNENERDFLMRASVFTKPLTFEALEVCNKKGVLSEILLSLAQRFYLVRRADYYYIHDIMKDFAFSKLKGDPRLYIEAQRATADYYRKKLSAENLLLVYYHLKEAGNHKEGFDSIIENIDYFWKEGYWSDVREILEESLDNLKEKGTRADIYLILGTVINSLGEWNRALVYFEKSLEIAERRGDVQGVGNIYNNMGLAFYFKSEWDRAEEYFYKSLKIKEETKDLHGMASVYDNLGLVYKRKGKWDRAEEYFYKSLEISKRIEDIRGIAQACNNLGLIYYYSKGKWDRAEEYYRESLEISEKLGDVHGKAQIYNNLGMVYHSKGKWDRAEEYYRESLEISEKLGDVHGIAQACNNLGEMYADKGEWDRARKYFEKSLKISEKIKDVYIMVYAYSNLGLYHSKGEWDRAGDYFERSLKISEKLEAFYSIAYTYCNLGLAYYNRSEWDRAREYYEKSLNISEKLGDVHGAAIAEYRSANVLRQKEEFDDALRLYFKSERTLKKLGDKYNLMKVYRNLSICYEDMNKKDKAHEYYQKSEELRKQLGIENL